VLLTACGSQPRGCRRIRLLVLPLACCRPDTRLYDFVTSYVSFVSFVLTPGVLTPGIYDNSTDADPALGRRPQPQLILQVVKVKVQKMCVMDAVPEWAKTDRRSRDESGVTSVESLAL